MTSTLTRSTASTLTDAVLIERTRDGDDRAFAELWNRHSGAATTLARRATRSFDSDDLVSEAFLRILKTIRRGKGPTTTFRPYLATAIRNLAATWHSREVPAVVLEDYEEYEEYLDHTPHSDVMLDAIEIFRGLPERWKQALWLSEVEQMTPAEIGRAFNIAPGAAAALTFRARRGLKQVWEDSRAA